MFNSFATPWTPLSLGFPRQEYWSGLPFPSPGDLSHPGIDPTFPWLQVDSLPLSHWGLPVSLFTQGIFLIPLFLLNPKASSSAYSTCFVFKASYIYEHFTFPFLPPLLWSLPLALWLGEFFTSLLLPYISWHPHNSRMILSHYEFHQALLCLKFYQTLLSICLMEKIFVLDF